MRDGRVCESWRTSPSYFMVTFSGYLREQCSVRYPVKPEHIINTLFSHTFSNENANRYLCGSPYGHKRNRIEFEISGRA
jgi:hypothetical protein